MRSCDVLIVGGGPAGAACAWALRHSGLDIVVLDSQQFPRDKICGGWITPPVLSELGIDPHQYGLGRTLQSITGFLVGRIAGSALETRFDQVVSYGIRRREFDDYLLKRSGATLLLGDPLTNLTRSPNGWIANHAIQARLVVGAGGHFCPVAKALKVSSAREEAVVAQETEFEMNAGQLARCCVRPDTPELYFCSDLKGYGWCFRKGNILNIGLGRADMHGLSGHVSGFLAFLKATGRIRFDVPPLRGHAYLLAGTSHRAPLQDGVLLVGDAAGLAYPQSGEGIRPAIESGLLAAKSIIEAKGDYRRRQLESYARFVSKGVQSSFSAACHRVAWPPLIPLAQTLLRSRWFVREVVLKRWFLHMTETALIASSQHDAGQAA